MGQQTALQRHTRHARPTHRWLPAENRQMYCHSNQESQKYVMNFISNCLDCDAQLVGGGQKDAAPARGLWH